MAGGVLSTFVQRGLATFNFTPFWHRSPKKAILPEPVVKRGNFVTVGRSLNVAQIDFYVFKLISYRYFLQPAFFWREIFFIHKQITI